MFPDPQHSPSLGLCHGVGFAVALGILCELRPPVVGMRCWNCSVLRTAVPEAAVDEDGESLTSEDDVRAPAFIAPRCIVDAIAQTASVE